MLLNSDGDWDYCNPCTELRSLADIRKIIELKSQAGSKKGLWVTSKALQIKKLEQQAMGINDFANEQCGDCLTIEASMLSHAAAAFCNRLIKQAKALKETGND